MAYKSESPVALHDGSFSKREADLDRKRINFDILT